MSFPQKFHYLLAFNIIHSLVTPKFISSRDLSPEFQTHVFDRPLGLSTWMSNWDLEYEFPQLNSWSSPQPAPLKASLSVHSNSLFLITQVKNLGILFGSFLFLIPPTKQLAHLFYFIFKICPESHHPSPPLQPPWSKVISSLPWNISITS